MPSEWCENIICPLYKSGASTNPENYRGISLINSKGKFFTVILTTWLQKWSEENGVIDESQAGFRKGYSTTDNIFAPQTIVQKYLCRQRGRFIVFSLILGALSIAFHIQNCGILFIGKE